MSDFISNNWNKKLTFLPVASLPAIGINNTLYYKTTAPSGFSFWNGTEYQSVGGEQIKPSTSLENGDVLYVGDYIDFDNKIWRITTQYTWSGAFVEDNGQNLGGDSNGRPFYYNLGPNEDDGPTASFDDTYTTPDNGGNNPQGFRVQDIIINDQVTPKEVWLCVDNTTGASIWIQTSVTLDEIIPLIDAAKVESKNRANHTGVESLRSLTVDNANNDPAGMPQTVNERGFDVDLGLLMTEPWVPVPYLISEGLPSDIYSIVEGASYFLRINKFAEVDIDLSKIKHYWKFHDGIEWYGEWAAVPLYGSLEVKGKGLRNNKIAWEYPTVMDYMNYQTAPTVTLAAGTDSEDAIDITFTHTSESGQGYIVERSTDQLTWSDEVYNGSGAGGMPPATQTTVNDTGLLAGTEYFYRVIVKGETGEWYPATSTVKSLTTTDTTAPVLSNASIDTITNSGATFNVQSVDNSGQSTVYYVVLADAATQPTTAQIKAGNDSSDVAATASGSIVSDGGQIETDVITGLTASTAYDLFYFSEDASGNQTIVSKLDFTTIA